MYFSLDQRQRQKSYLHVSRRNEYTPEQILVLHIALDVTPMILHDSLEQIFLDFHHQYLPTGPTNPVRGVHGILVEY